MFGREPFLTTAHKMEIARSFPFIFLAIFFFVTRLVFRALLPLLVRVFGIIE